MNTAHKRALVEKLWQNQLGLCRWCGRETYLYNDPRRIRPKSGTLSGKAATLDHLYTRFNPLRFARIRGYRYVVACSTCNQDIELDDQRTALADTLRTEILVHPLPARQRPPSLQFRVEDNAPES